MGGIHLTFDRRRLGLMQRPTRWMVWLGLASVLVVSLACENGLGGPATGTSTPTQVPATEPPLAATATPILLPTATYTQTPVPTPTDTPAPGADRDILAALYDATDGASWEGNDNWLSDAPVGEWHGVTADGSGRVTELDLTDNGLAGTIPDSLGSLSQLGTLDLGFNRLSGEIPAALANLTKLSDLTLQQNQLSGAIPSQLGTLVNLSVLRLNNNDLTGTIPPELGNLTELTALWLSVNKLTGAIPSQLGNLTELASLRLNFNELNGPILPQLGNLTRLRTLWLNDNSLAGEIPSQLGNLTELRDLRLSNNDLNGCIPQALRAVAQHDLDDLGLPDCGSPTATPTPTSTPEPTPTPTPGPTVTPTPPVVDPDAFKRKPSEDFDGLEAAGNADPTGIWSDGVTMWVADLDDDKIYAYDMTTRERVPARISIHSTPLPTFGRTDLVQDLRLRLSHGQQGVAPSQGL